MHDALFRIALVTSQCFTQTDCMSTDAFKIEVNKMLESILTCCLCSYDVHAFCHVLSLITPIGPYSFAATRGGLSNMGLCCDNSC